MICPTCVNAQTRPAKDENMYFCDRCRTTFYQAPIQREVQPAIKEEVKRGDTFDYEQLLESMVQLKTEATEGVGFIVSEQGHVMTNAHVLDGAEFCIGQLANKAKRHEFDVVADGDPMSLDVCLLKPSEEVTFTPMKLSKR